MNKLLKAERKQKPFTVLGPLHIAIIFSVTLKGALVRYTKRFKEKPDAVYNGYMIN